MDVYLASVEVQKAIHALLSDPVRQVEVRAFDGTDGRVLEMLKWRLRRASTEICEEKIYRENQRERQLTFDEDTADLLPLTKAAMRAEMDLPFPSRSFVMQTLTFIQLLCEGHNNDLQMLLCEQTELSAANVDLVTEVYELLLALEPEMTSDNLSQVHKCLEALTEFVQGNVSGRVCGPEPMFLLRPSNTS